MLYAVRFSGYKIDTFLKIFCVFQEVCRLEYLKPFTCKGSRSELFTNSLPRKGMETSGGVNRHRFLSFPTLQTHCPERGWKPIPSPVHPKDWRTPLQTHCPERGWKLNFP